MKKFSAALAIAFAAAIGISADVSFDPTTGIGWVGKGDVQTVFGMNNKALQNQAENVEFRYNASTETTWTCTKPHPAGHDDIVQHRNNSTSIEGVVDSIARENSKGKDGPVTGFHLLGFNGGSTIDNDGPEIGSCPAQQSGFVYDNNAVTTTLGGGLQVSINGTDWFDLQ